MPIHIFSRGNEKAQRAETERVLGYNPEIKALCDELETFQVIKKEDKQATKRFIAEIILNNTFFSPFATDARWKAYAENNWPEARDKVVDATHGQKVDAEEGAAGHAIIDAAHIAGYDKVMPIIQRAVMIAVTDVAVAAFGATVASHWPGVEDMSRDAIRYAEYLVMKSHVDKDKTLTEHFEHVKSDWSVWLTGNARFRNIGGEKQVYSAPTSTSLVYAPTPLAYAPTPVSLRKKES